MHDAGYSLPQWIHISRPFLPKGSHSSSYFHVKTNKNNKKFNFSLLFKYPGTHVISFALEDVLQRIFEPILVLF